MTRVAVAVPGHERCGVADYARQLSAALPGRFEVSTIACPKASSSKSIDRRAWRRAAALADGADVVHVHYEYGLFGSVKPLRNCFGTFMKRLRAPSVVTLHDVLPRITPRWTSTERYGAGDLFRDLVYLPFFRGWEAAQYQLASHWLVHNREQRATVAAHVGEQRVSLSVHPIPDASAFSLVASRRLPQEEADDGALLVSPGFVKEHKGYLAFLECLKELEPRISWTIAGGAQDERDQRTVDRLNGAIRERDLSPRVHVTGYLPIERLVELTANSTVAVFPFERATGSGSVAWAIAVGRPILTTDIPSMVELKQAGAGIELLPMSDRACWPRRIRELLASAQRLDELASKNLGFGVNHSYLHAGERLAALFDQVLAA